MISIPSTSNGRRPESGLLHQQLQEFLAVIDVPALAADIAVGLGIGSVEAQKRLVRYMNETAFSLRVVEPYLRPDRRILEVGSGTGLFSLFLRGAGYDVTAIEPVGPGYDFMGQAFSSLRAVYRDIALPFFPIGAEQLSAGEHGTFDLIFSIHVLEHIPDLAAGLEAMSRVLAPNGRMVHACPNYAFPYDPHFGIPLLPLIPKRTSWLLPKHIAESGRWQSINFITAARLEGLADRLGLRVTYVPGLLGEMVRRTAKDPVFAARHRGIAGVFSRLARIGRVDALLARLPPRWVSPMIVSLERG